MHATYPDSDELIVDILSDPDGTIDVYNDHTLHTERSFNAGIAITRALQDLRYDMDLDGRMPGDADYNADNTLFQLVDETIPIGCDAFEAALIIRILHAYGYL